MLSATSSKTGRVVLLTGASRGIGMHLARALLASDFAVAGVSRSPTEDPTLRRYVDGNDGRMVEWLADVGDRDAVRAAVTQIVSRWGRIDALINNAGCKLFADFAEISPAQFEQVTRTNLLGPVYLCQEVVPVMVRQGHGRIVNIASRAGLEFSPQGTAYCASKAGLIGFSQSLAEALRGTGVSVNVLCPPTVLTPEYLEAKPDLDAARMVTVEQVIDVVLDLLRPGCRTTGRVYPFYSVRSFVKGALLDVRKYLQWLPQLRYRAW